MWAEKGGTAWGLTHGILRWCETSEDTLFAKMLEGVAEEHPEAHSAWRSTVFRASLRREAKVYMFTDLLPELKVSLTMRLIRVGRTSYTVEYTICGVPSNNLIAIVHIALVNVNLKNMRESSPIAYPELFKKFISPPQLGGVFPKVKRGGTPSVYKTVVRVSDTDVNGHLNNCVHANMAFDSLPLPDVPKMGYVCVEYIRQSVPGAKLDISCWTCEETEMEVREGGRGDAVERERVATYDCEYHESDGTLVARATLAVLPKKYHSKENFWHLDLDAAKL